MDVLQHLDQLRRVDLIFPQIYYALLILPLMINHFFVRVQRTSERLFPGLVNFVPAVSYHFGLNLPEAFSQPGNDLLEIPRPRREEEEKGLSISFLEIW